MFFRRDNVDEAFRVELPGLLTVFQRFLEFFRLNARLAAQIDMRVGVFHRVEDVVAFVLRVVHPERVLNVLGQRMHLQAQVSAADGVQKVKANREFRAEARVNLVTQERFRFLMHQIDGGCFHNDAVHIQQEAVFLRHTIEAPCVIGLFRGKPADGLHPLPAPNAGVEIRRNAEGLRDRLFERIAVAVAGHHAGRLGVVGVQQVVNMRMQRPLMAVEDAPFDEVAALIFAQRVFVVVVIEPVCQFAGAEAQLDFPARHVRIHQYIGMLAQQRRADAEHQPDTVHQCDFLPKRRYPFHVEELLDAVVRHDAEHTVIGQVVFQHGIDLLFGERRLCRAEDARRVQLLCQRAQHIRFPHAVIAVHANDGVRLAHNGFAQLCADSFPALPCADTLCPHMENRTLIVIAFSHASS